MKTKKGTRAVHVGVRIAEDAKGVTLLFDGHDFPPDLFQREDGKLGQEVVREADADPRRDRVARRGERSYEGGDESRRARSQDRIEGGREGRLPAERQRTRVLGRAVPIS